MVPPRKIGLAASVAAALALADLPNNAEARFYERAGEGRCQPASYASYSRMETGGVETPDDCARACEGANTKRNSFRYRGFSHVSTALRGAKANCLCFYDCKHLPRYERELKSAWGRYDPESCDRYDRGRVKAWDGQSDFWCYVYY